MADLCKIMQKWFFPTNQSFSTVKASSVPTNGPFIDFGDRLSGKKIIFQNNFYRNTFSVGLF